jgi:transposase
VSKAIAITNLEHTAAELREFAAKTKDAEVARRLLALAMVLEDKSRTEAATQNAMQRQTLRDWVHRYNAEGVAGLASRVAPGRAAPLSAQQMAELRVLVVKGPDPERDGVVRWRCVDLREQIVRRFSVELHERTVGKLLRRLGLTRLQPRPYHPKKDAAAQEIFKKTSPGSRSIAGLGRRQTDRDMVSRRSQSWPKGLDCLCLGAGRLPAADGARQPS